MEEAGIHNHLGTRVTALLEIKELLENEDNFYQIQNYGSSFLRFLNSLLKDNSQEVLSCVFKIYNRLLAIPGFNQRGNFQSVLT